ncbi:MAG: molybdopterin molybdotransferase MoeA [Alphaproteobacteria bacterium]|nr:molybdopterin molybdotransferase MoeA [Alphaproteobacteria bacterium]
MIPVAEALARITGAFTPLSAEQVGLTNALGRVLSEDVVSRRSQPPVAVSAMDGYAVRAEDVSSVPTVLKRIGEAPAGSVFEGVVGPGEAVRIFTGGPVPKGADAIVIQENTEVDGARITVKESSGPGHYIREAGLDFSQGVVGLKVGTRLGPAEIGLAAAMNVPWLKVRRRPRIAVMATGDEIVMPGEPIGPHQIVSSNGPAMSAFIAERGGVPIDLGIAGDTEASIRETAAGAAGADLLVTCGGASVGEHDLIQSALAPDGLAVDFWKIAMRPGKPLIFGQLGQTPLLGLPGNPVSSMVCAILFLAPVIEKMLGVEKAPGVAQTARLGHDVMANDRRQDYLRATLARDTDDALIATPFEKQDSAMLARFVAADCLIVRPPNAPAAKQGDIAEIILLG